MQIKDIDILISEADQMLDNATQELERSEEDVTTFMVCHNSRQSIVNYLSSYLLKNGIELNKPVTVAGLMEQCKQEDGRFQLIDISPIFCSHDESDEEYCLDVHKVNACLRIAKQLRNIAITESPTH